MRMLVVATLIVLLLTPTGNTLPDGASGSTTQRVEGFVTKCEPGVYPALPPTTACTGAVGGCEFGPSDCSEVTEKSPYVKGHCVPGWIFNHCKYKSWQIERTLWTCNEVVCGIVEGQVKTACVWEATGTAWSWLTDCD